MTIPTPLFDAWRATANRQLAERGRKTALAEHLTKRYGRTVHSWQSYLNAILNGRRLPNAEIVMAIDAWFAKN
jgi:hypothetical protein